MPFFLQFPRGGKCTILAEVENGDNRVCHIFINNLSERQLNAAMELVFTNQT
jgi:hypothetical protein